MTRPLRIDVANGWYHVTARGFERRTIFRDERDGAHFLELLEEMVPRFGVVLHAYVLMGNHYHLLLQTPSANTSRALQWLNVSYGVWFNRRHQRCGPLFQGRFKSVPVEDDGAWALELSTYLHLNPVRLQRLGRGKAARSVERVGAARPPGREVVSQWLKTLREHGFSSYGAYAGYRSKPAWLTCEVLWDRAKRKGLAAMLSYRWHVEGRLRQGVEEGGWERLTAGLAIGSLEFVERMRRLVKGDGREQPALRQWKRLLPFARVKERVETAKGEKWAAFRDRRGDWGRDVALWLGRRHCGLTLRELGKEAGADYQAVSKAVIRMRHLMEQDRRLRRQVEDIETSLSKIQT
jgi:REP element-mobilizing transposase RayT